MSLRFYPKLFLAVFLAFVAFTVIGTLSHEGGHYLVARGFGYSPSIHYGYMMSGENKVYEEAMAIRARHKKAITSGLDYPEKERFDELAVKAKNQGFWITLGGPLQTMLTGTIGLFLVLWRKSKKAYASSLLDWLFIATYVILTFVPKEKILTFGIGGLLGGVTGYVLWLKILGPIVMP